MALTINDGCTACDACRPVCPNEAGAEDEPQCMLVCPADCIVPHPDFVETHEELLAKYESLHG